MDEIRGGNVMVTTYTAYRMMVSIKKKLNKSKDDLLTVTEFCVVIEDGGRRGDGGD